MYSNVGRAELEVGPVPLFHSRFRGAALQSRDRRQHLKRAITVCLCLASLAGPRAERQLESRFLLASVVDSGSGTPLMGLMPSDFVVFEDGVQRDVLEVRPADYPVALLLDTSRHAQRDFMKLRGAVHRLAGSLTGRLVSFTTFGDTPSRVVQFTTEVPKVLRGIDGSFAKPDTDSYMLDAVIDTAKEVRRRELPLCALIVISAGGNDRSGRTPADVLDPVLKSRSIVHIAEARGIRASGRLTQPRGIRKHLDVGIQAALAMQDFLRALATRTGGRYEALLEGGAYEEVLQLIGRRLIAEVIVEYAAPVGAPNRDLKIGMSLPGATVTGQGLADWKW